MKLTKAQEDFLNICWKMKVVNIVPQAAKLGIPEAYVREYLGKRGLAIDQGGFVFQGKRKEALRVTPKDFMEAVRVANRRFNEAVQAYTRIKKKGMPKDGFAQINGELAEAEKRIKDRQGDILWLVGGLLEPSDKEWKILAHGEMVELLKIGKR